MPNANIAFLNDMLQAVSARVRSKVFPKGPSAPAEQQLLDGCAELMRHGGEASRIAIAANALDAYTTLSTEAKLRFFRVLLDQYSADPAQVRAAYERWHDKPDEAALAALFNAVEPRRQKLLRLLNHPPGGTLQLVRMREDLLTFMRDAPDLAPLDSDFNHLLTSWFNRGFLVMRRIDWNSPASILEKIVAYEAVHEIRDWDDLRRRLDPADRRCYGFFHPATGDEPLIFVEIALCEGIPDAVGPLLDARHAPGSAQANTAVFYSISNCQPGLKGVSFGNFLIKQVVRDLSQDVPQLKTFVTLSPAPGFARWLADQPDDAARELSSALATGDWQQDAELRGTLMPQVQEMAARYFVRAKTKSGMPIDPVARFHLGNGASAHRINWPADLAAGALKNAHGVMINYLYELDRIEANHEAYARDGAVACGPEVRRILRGAKDTVA